MKYLLMITLNPADWDLLADAEREAVFRAHDEFQQRTAETGELVSTEPLADPSESATVRVRQGSAMVTDGPFIEAKEYIAGYYLLDCASRDRAIELAGQLPEAAFGAIEVRPLMTYDRRAH